MPAQLSVNVIIDDPDLLQKLRVASGAKDAGEVLRKAIGLLVWAYEQENSGLTICVHKNGEIVQAIQVFVASTLQKALDGLDDKTVAHKLGVSVTTVTRWRLGSVVPHRLMLPTILDMCEKLRGSK